MKLSGITRFGLAALLFSALIPAHAELAPDTGQIEISVGRLLEQGHYSRHELDDKLSQRLLSNYLDSLDYNHLYFLQSDIDKFQEDYATALDDDILLGNPDPALEIFATFKKRVEDRVNFVKQYIQDHQFEFASDRTIDLNRHKLAFPKDEAEAEAIWKRRAEGEMLQAKLNEHAMRPPLETVTRRFDQTLRSVREQTSDDVIAGFLSALAQTYDPHSEYLSKDELDNFAISMKLSLVGIGAVLKPEDGYAKVYDLVPGGPAERGGRLKVGDRIAAVAQGDQEFVDTVDMKLDKVVAMIRGKKATTVRLQVVPTGAVDPSKLKVVEIVRDNVKITDGEAKAQIIEANNPDGDAPERVGWITLPSFYADMDKAGAEDAKSTTKDVSALLERLKQEQISGLVVDLRQNGGGSLEEAIRLTGLFVGKGPVVQSKDSSGKRRVQSDDRREPLYDGPMVVVTNRLSASASEIFAAALQDYGRAVVVGDGSTFGKGTVQTMLEIGKFIPFLGSDDSAAGALKLTIQKFYRIAGGSTQLRGVTSDIRLPSIYDQTEIGESALNDPMPYDEVKPASYEAFASVALPLQQLQARSSERVRKDPEFQYIVDDLSRMRERIEKNTISLNEQQRRKEFDQEKTREKRRIAERKERGYADQKIYRITLENVNDPELKEIGPEEALVSKRRITDPADDENAEEDTGPEVDPVRNETLKIALDLIELSRTAKTAAAK